MAIPTVTPGHATRAVLPAATPPRAVRKRRVAAPVVIAQPALRPVERHPHDAAVIAAALAILDSRLREPTAAYQRPETAKNFLRLHLGDVDRELFAVMFLDAQLRLISFEVMFQGTLTHTTVHVREVMKRALALNAGAVVLAHNHPSGLAEPSRADELITQSLRQALLLVDVRVIDHVVVGADEAMSFAERGLL